MNDHSLVALSTLTGLTRVRAFAAFKELQTQSGAATLEEVIACASPDANVERLAAQARAAAGPLLISAAASGILPIRSDDDRYPPLLRTIADPPPILWCLGTVEV